MGDYTSFWHWRTSMLIIPEASEETRNSETHGKSNLRKFWKTSKCLRPRNASQTYTPESEPDQDHRKNQDLGMPPPRAWNLKMPQFQTPCPVTSELEMLNDLEMPHSPGKPRHPKLTPRYFRNLTSIPGKSRPRNALIPGNWPRNALHPVSWNIARGVYAK
jgi:hypothetical protein